MDIFCLVGRQDFAIQTTRRVSLRLDKSRLRDTCPYIREPSESPAVMCSTAGNLMRSISCQEETCVIAWSCGKDPATSATDSNPSRHHHRQTQRNGRSPFAHDRRSYAVKVTRAISSSAEELAADAVNSMSKHREDDFDGRTEAEQEEHDPCTMTEIMVNACDIAELGVQSYDVPVDSCCKHAELQSNTGAEIIGDNITESRATIEAVVSIRPISPAECDDATNVSAEVVALPRDDVRCRIDEDEISRQQLSRLAVDEPGPSNANIDGDGPFEEVSRCIYNGATSTELTRRKMDERLSVITKRRGRHKGRSQRIGRKWKPAAEHVVQLDFQMSLFPRNVSVEVDIDNSAAIMKELEQFERSLDCPEDADDDKSSTENGSGIMTDRKQTDVCVSDCSDRPTQNCGENLEYREQKSPEDNNNSLHTISTSTKDDILDYEDDNADLMSFYGDKIPRCIRSSFGNEPYLPGCQRLRMKKKWKTTKARIQVKTRHCRTVNNTVHGQPIYINFRVMLRMHLELRSIHSNPYYHTLSLRKIDKCKGKPVGGVDDGKGKRHGSYNNRDVSRPPAAPRYAMDAYNADSDLSADLVNVLMNLQHRDLLPEDYELLLRLDDRVAQKTIDSSVLSTLKTEVVGPDGRAELCAICMEPYEAGHTMKYLPCGHGYHDTCIDRWLSNSSQNCPLDGVPIEDADRKSVV